MASPAKQPDNDGARLVGGPPERTPPGKDRPLDDNPHWYRDAVIYEVHVKSFHDGSGDGIGDFPGLIRKLDYLAGLGITALWLLPFYPSPLRDDGYDTANYLEVHPNYGTLKDFRTFLRQAHRRGIRVITELVLNHTSDQHPWFQRARSARPGSSWRDFYVWTDNVEKYAEARIIFKDFETSNWSWDPVAKAYYWHRFYSHQPDLNFHNPRVQDALLKVVNFWFQLGVDGLRLDAIPYLFERENTNCENLPETHAFLKKLRRHVDERFPNRMLLGEANQWPEDAARYFGAGDECHMAFHFPLMPRLFMALQMEDRYPIIDILEQTPQIPATCQWGMFLRNHDELTLEMVTDEERDYMYRVYARDQRTRINLGIRRRLAPLVGNSRRKIELMNLLLFSLPGTPIIYYGDEIGMGDNFYLGDRDGVRTPMQWSGDRNAGFSRANPQMLYLPVITDPEYHYEAINVESQEGNTSSLLWWMKRVIAMRRRYKAFSRGDLAFVPSDNPKVIAFTRRCESETILVVINLARFAQVVSLDLGQHIGAVPVEAFSHNRFPEIKEARYVLTMGFHDYFWFILQPPAIATTAVEGRSFPELAVDTAPWANVLEGEARTRLEEGALPGFCRCARWFGGKASTISDLRVIEHLPLERSPAAARLVLIEVGYTDATAERYLLPLAFATGEAAARLVAQSPECVIARLHAGAEAGVIYDGTCDEACRSALLALIAGRGRVRGEAGILGGLPGRDFRALLGDTSLPLASRLLKAEQSNSSVLYENRFFLKLYRRLEEGINPDAELVRYLSEKSEFTAAPPFAGLLEYRRPGSDTIVIGQLQGFVDNQGDAWSFTLDAVHRFFERVIGAEKVPAVLQSWQPSGLGFPAAAIPAVLQDFIGSVIPEMAVLLGRRTGELHLALAAAKGDPAFEPESFSMLYQRSLYQSMRNLTRRVLRLLRDRMGRLPADLRSEASGVALTEPEILKHFQPLLETKIVATKIRYHGDLHLGQVLRTGKDYRFIDFEGEPARPLSERRLKRSPLRDVAGMIRSFHYAVSTFRLKHGSLRPEDAIRFDPWAGLWYRAVAGMYLNAYLETVGNAPFLPPDTQDREMLLSIFLLEKAIYELGYELGNRPDWIGIPIRGVRHILQGGAA